MITSAYFAFHLSVSAYGRSKQLTVV